MEIAILLGLYWGCMGIMEKVETTVMCYIGFRVEPVGCVFASWVPLYIAPTSLPPQIRLSRDN